MKILLIEDEIAKEKDILKYLKELCINDVVVKHSITSGIAEIREKSFDHILLDMSLPLFYDTTAEDFNLISFKNFSFSSIVNMSPPKILDISSRYSQYNVAANRSKSDISLDLVLL